MKKRNKFIEIDNLIIRASLVQTVELRQDYYNNDYIRIVYRSPEGLVTFNSQSEKFNGNIYANKYKELKEALG